MITWSQSCRILDAFLNAYLGHFNGVRRLSKRVKVIYYLNQYIWKNSTLIDFLKSLIHDNFKVMNFMVATSFTLQPKDQEVISSSKGYEKCDHALSC